MANQQNNPGFVTGQVPSADTWNAAWTVKQDALIASISVSVDTTVPNTVCKVVVDTSAGNVRITVPPSYGSAGRENWVRIIKKSATPNANQVLISNGSAVVAYIVTENDGSGGGWLDVYANGTVITQVCGVP
jgi:hypothetical protein